MWEKKKKGNNKKSLHQSDRLVPFKGGEKIKTGPQHIYFTLEEKKKKRDKIYLFFSLIFLLCEVINFDTSVQKAMDGYTLVEAVSRNTIHPKIKCRKKYIRFSLGHGPYVS